MCDCDINIYECVLYIYEYVNIYEISRQEYDILYVRMRRFYEKLDISM